MAIASVVIGCGGSEVELGPAESAGGFGGGGASASTLVGPSAGGGSAIGPGAGGAVPDPGAGGGGSPGSSTGQGGAVPGPSTGGGDPGPAPPTKPGSDTPTVLADGSKCFEGAFTPFLGDLHVHLRGHKDSPCNYTAAQALDAAKKRGLNFIQITEHVWRLTASELKKCQDAAAATINPTFRPGCGFETNVVMADGQYSGHANAFWAPDNHNVNPSDAVGENFKTASGKSDFFAYVNKSKAVGQINHPNNDEDGWPDDEAKYANGAIDLVELSGSCGGCADRKAAAIKKFLRFVNRGWKVGPSMNSDTHCPAEPGKEPERRTGLWVAGSAVRKAILNHRSFVTSHDPPQGSQSAFRLAIVKEASDGAHECWMGSTVKRPAPDKAARLVVQLGGHMVEKATGPVTMKVFARGSGYDSPLATASCGASGECACAGGTCTWTREVTPSAEMDSFVAYAESETGGKAWWTLSSPVWLTD